MLWLFAKNNFQFIALFNCTVGNAVLGVPSEKFDLDGQIFCIFLHQSAKMLRFALGTLRTAFPTGLHSNRAINCNLPIPRKKVAVVHSHDGNS